MIYTVVLLSTVLSSILQHRVTTISVHNSFNNSVNFKSQQLVKFITMADASKLKLGRRNNKGQLTRTLSMIESLIKEDVDLEVLKKYIIKAEEQFGRIELRHSELMDVIEDQVEFETEEKWMSECETDFMQKLILAKREIHPVL